MINEIAWEVRKKILIPLAEFEEPLETAATSAPKIIAKQVSVFRSGLAGNWRVATLPYTLVSDAVIQHRFSHMLSAESIRKLRPNEGLADEDRKEAASIARGKMDVFVESQGGKIVLMEDVLHGLLRLTKRRELDESLQELLLETVVMLWGTLEVFISDTIRTLLNASPSMSAVLLTADETKKHFPSRGISVEDLAKNDFNLSTSMGDVILANVRLDSLPVIREILKVMYPNDTNLHEKLRADELWILWQRRNLIAHRRGIVDQLYVSKTGDNTPVGERLALTGFYLDNCATLVRDVGIALINAIASKGPTGAL